MGDRLGVVSADPAVALCQRRTAPPTEQIASKKIGAIRDKLEIG